jgi:hypothetical protein
MEVLTSQELEAKRLRLEEKYPDLPKWWARARSDCHFNCHIYSEFIHEHGSDETLALREYDLLMWLLGET